jgi:hypothetical protein
LPQARTTGVVGQQFFRINDLIALSCRLSPGFVS